MMQKRNKKMVFMTVAMVMSLFMAVSAIVFASLWIVHKNSEGNRIETRRNDGTIEVRMSRHVESAE